MDQYDDRWEDWTQWVDGRYCCFSYILLSSPLVRLVSEHREGVVEEKIFPASVCDCITFCLGVFFVSFHHRSLAAVIRRSTIVDL